MVLRETSPWVLVFKKSNICDILRDLIPFVRFKKHKHSWRNVTFSKVAGFQPATLLKVTLFHGCFSRFLNCTIDTKSCNASHIMPVHMSNRVETILLFLFYLSLGLEYTKHRVLFRPVICKKSILRQWSNVKKLELRRYPISL